MSSAETINRLRADRYALRAEVRNQRAALSLAVEGNNILAEQLRERTAEVERLTRELDSAMQLLDRLAPGAIRNPLGTPTTRLRGQAERVAAEREKTLAAMWNTPATDALREGGAA